MELEGFSDREICPRISKKEAENRTRCQYCKARKLLIFNGMLVRGEVLWCDKLLLLFAF